MQPKLKRFYAHINTHFIQQAHITLIIILKKNGFYRNIKQHNRFQHL